ncbi:hypothetical protein I2I11_13190 [Pontibacter sp. 172403-2]|uniref:hypothetical protein n=1 Tax=Pontibacter rufus TaxID=2791028 RepID=UPI0018AFABCC|nr:hypothetical protein [Pontibacter sp. 172403-2]MBF9254253.1 hypothetical protein [Pontibacter sp. 172403-2]
MKQAAFAILIALFTSAAFAQGAGKQAAKATAQQAEPDITQRARAITDSMVKSLHLNAEQAKKIQSINLTSMQSAEAAKEKYKAHPRKMVAQMDIINETRLSQIKDALTPQQFQQYQQRREEKMGVPQEAQSNPEARQRSPLNQESY